MMVFMKISFFRNIIPSLFTGIAHFPNCLRVAFVYVAVLLFKSVFAALLIQLGARAEARA